jgi:FkbM family methyltransferase
MVRIAKKILKKLLHLAGYRVERMGIVQPAVEPPYLAYNTGMHQGLSRAKARGLEPVTIFDVGAASGKWTEDALKLWPSSHYVLVEPLTEQLRSIQNMKQRLLQAKVDTVGAVLGSGKGEVNFNVSPDLDGSGVYDQASPNSRTVPMTSLDIIQEELNTKGPYLLKLDTHGFELPILAGASSILTQTELIVVEVYGFYISPTAKTFWEMCQHLDNLGFRLIDIVDVMHRPGDSAFWQCDAFFLPKSSPIFANNAYQ